MSSKQFFSRDGTLVYEVALYVVDEMRTYRWFVPLTDEQAGTIRESIKALEADGKVGFWEVRIKTISVDDLKEIGDAIKRITATNKAPERGEASESPQRPGRAD